MRESSSVQAYPRSLRHSHSMHTESLHQDGEKALLEYTH